MMGRSQKPSSLTLRARPEHQLPLPQSMHLISDRIVHAIALLVFQAFGVPELAIASMLGVIENMKLFLRTCFGDSKRFASGGVSVKVQGLTQGNGASPAGWAVISIVILRAHGKKGHGAKFRCPITNLLAHISAILYVNDMDLLDINFDHNESVDDAHAAIQKSVKSWGNLLIAIGGALEPEKCFIQLYYLNGFVRSGNTKIIVSMAASESQCQSQEGAPQPSYIVPLPTQKRHSAL
jgi:hypothetical protein